MALPLLLFSMYLVIPFLIDKVSFRFLSFFVGATSWSRPGGRSYRISTENDTLYFRNGITLYIVPAGRNVYRT